LTAVGRFTKSSFGKEEGKE